jgi:hypothetical protein
MYLLSRFAFTKALCASFAIVIVLSNFFLKVVLVFPGKNSLTLEEMAKQVNGNESVCREDSHTDDAGDAPADGQNDSPNMDIKQHNSEPGGESIDMERENQSVSDKTTLEGKLDNSLLLKRKAEDHLGRQKRIRRSIQRAPFERAVFVDSTWKQTKGITADDRLKGTAWLLPQTFIHQCLLSVEIYASAYSYWYTIDIDTENI